VAIFSLLAPAPAAATLFCTVLESPDDFVVLRAGPNPHARLMARMQPGDEVQAIAGGRRGWQEVYHWHGLDRLDPEKAHSRNFGTSLVMSVPDVS
jgi:hypothetical protein